MNGHVYIMEYHSAIKREWSLAICDNMGGPQEHSAKC